jgi:hypothetical protein
MDAEQQRLICRIGAREEEFLRSSRDVRRAGNCSVIVQLLEKAGAFGPFG